jgi:Icc-related predicted phosphoesterase
MKKWKTVIMSDLHLGARQSQTEKILEFLEKNEMETLILNGDIIDGWAIRSNGKWTNDCTKIIRKIIKLYDMCKDDVVNPLMTKINQRVDGKCIVNPKLYDKLVVKTNSKYKTKK